MSNRGDGVIIKEPTSVETTFLAYQAELDVRYDKHERLVKKSRDLTIESKRIIFLLHRITSAKDAEVILHEAEQRLCNVYRDLIHGILSELTKREVYQFIRAYSAGVQEFVEAITFFYYLRNGRLASIEEIYKPDFLQNYPADGEEESRCLALSHLLMPPDFVLGVADLTGELMRKCIGAVAAGDLDLPFELRLVLQDIHESFVLMDRGNRELRRKLGVLKSSVTKVENACYAIRIRGSEIPRHMLADFFSAEEDYRESNYCDL